MSHAPASAWLAAMAFAASSRSFRRGIETNVLTLCTSDNHLNLIQNALNSWDKVHLLQWYFLLSFSVGHSSALLVAIVQPGSRLFFQ